MNIHEPTNPYQPSASLPNMSASPETNPRMHAIYFFAAVLLLIVPSVLILGLGKFSNFHLTVAAINLLLGGPMAMAISLRSILDRKSCPNRFILVVTQLLVWTHPPWAALMLLGVWGILNGA